MHKTIYTTIVLILVLVTAGFTQNPEWLDLSDQRPQQGFIQQMAFDSNGDLWLVYPFSQYNGETWMVHSDTTLGHELNDISSLVVDAQDDIWIGCHEEDGLICFDGENWSYFDLRNWGLPENVVYSLSVDQQGAIWIGTAAGIVRFDGTTWTVYDPSNSPISSTEEVQSIAIDDNNVKWIGMSDSQVATILSFDDTTWTVYNESNTGVDFGGVRSIVIDGNGSKWFLDGGSNLYNLDGDTCTRYDLQDSGVSVWGTLCLAIDTDDAIWIGTGEIGGIMMPTFSGNGLIKYDGINWTILDTSNSEIPGDFVSALAINENGNIWIATLPTGIAIYNPTGIVGLDYEGEEVPVKMHLHQNYPNPFNPTTTISYSVPSMSGVTLKVYDIAGRNITTLRDTHQPAGNYSLQWNGVDQSGNQVSTGVYFARLDAGEFSQTIKMLYIK
ncbi:MAG: T9SS type A sorting domain-containing protein [Candidatus Marinimicrobia bacterium]|nr:T9SS type A sorting domain-containing protein [Candidatus Neomarinimicrobiota bacterium]